MTQTAESTTEVVGCLPMIVRHAGARPQPCSDGGQVSAYVVVLHQPQAQKVAILLTDGRFGTSITNAADEIVKYIQEAYLSVLDVDINDSRWIYRDSDGAWDEIMPTGGHGRRRQQVCFRPVGRRSLEDVLACIKAEGFDLAEADRARVHAFLRL